MTKWIGAAILTFTLMFSGSAAINSAAASPLQNAGPKQRTTEAADFSGRRHTHHHRYAHRPYYPYYCDRPYYYAPAPFFPFLGLGYGPWW
jgi:hypothetical protein